jgi:hypothetical protein
MLDIDLRIKCLLAPVKWSFQQKADALRVGFVIKSFMTNGYQSSLFAVVMPMCLTKSFGGGNAQMHMQMT